jgi:hypothetical protein
MPATGRMTDERDDCVSEQQADDRHQRNEAIRRSAGIVQRSSR